MARLPTRDDLGEMPSARSGQAIATIDDRAAGAVGHGIAKLGEEISEVGKKLHQKQEQNEEADVERRVLEFTRDSERDLQERRRNMERGGEGFADNWRSGYDTNAREVFGRGRTEGLSHRALQRLDIGLLRAGERLHTRAYEYQNQEHDRFTQQETNDRIAGVIGSFTSRDDIIENAEDYLTRGRAEIRALVRSGGLSAAHRYAAERTALRLFDERMLEAMGIRAGTDPTLRAEVQRLTIGVVRQPPPPRRPPGSDFDRPPPGDQAVPPPVAPPARQPPGDQVTPTPSGEWRTETTPERQPADLTTPSGRMLATYNAFRRAGFSDAASRALVAEVGRENDFRPDLMFGSHGEPGPTHRGRTNRGILSWGDPDRQAAFLDFMRRQPGDLVDENGRIAQTQEALDAQARFVREEMSGRYQRTWTALQNPNVTYEEANRLLGTDYIGWRFTDPEFQGHHGRRDRHYREISRLVGEQGGAQRQPPGDIDRDVGILSPPEHLAQPPPAAPPPPPPGLITPANAVNLDLIRFERPDGVNPANVNSYVIEADGQFVVIPGFDERGRRINADQALRLFRTTDRHLGIFDTRENALAHQSSLRDGPPRTERTSVQDDRELTGSLFQYAHGANRRVARQMAMLDRQDATALNQQIDRWEREIREGNLPPREDFAAVWQRALSLPNGDALRVRLEAVGRYGLFMHELMRMSPQAMVERINAERQSQLANPNTSETARQWLRTAEQFVNRIDGQIRSNTIELANQRGIASFGAIDYTNADSMANHAAGLQLVQGWLGRPSPRVFSDIERDRALSIMRRGGDEMLNLVGSMTRHWGQDLARRAIQELAGAEHRSGDVNEIVTAGMMFVNAQDNPALMPAARALAQAIRDRADNPEVREAIRGMIKNEDRADAASILDNAYQLSNPTRASVLAAADLLYYQRAMSRNITSFDPRLYRQGILDIIGQTTQGNRTYGGLYYQNWMGNRDPIIVPPNMRREGVRHALEVLNLWDIVDEHGFGPMGSDGRYITMPELRRMTMVSAGNGIYRFAEGDPRSGTARWVTNGTGQPFELDINRLSGTTENPGLLRRRMPEMYRGYEEGVPGSFMPDIMSRDWRGPRVPGAGAINWLTEATDANREARIREFDRIYGTGRARGVLEALEERRRRDDDAAPGGPR